LTFAQRKSNSKVKLNFGLKVSTLAGFAQRIAERKAKSKVKVTQCIALDRQKNFHGFQQCCATAQCVSNKIMNTIMLKQSRCRLVGSTVLPRSEWLYKHITFKMSAQFVIDYAVEIQINIIIIIILLLIIITVSVKLVIKM